MQNGVELSKMEVHEGNLTFDGCNFTNNTAIGGGGAITNNNGVLTVNNCNFTDNAVINETTSDYNGNGGAIYSRSDAPNIAVNIIFGSTFTGNTATKGGAIFNNGAYYGSGAILSGDNLLIMNFCQMVGNTPVDIYNNNNNSADLQYNWWGSNKDPSRKSCTGTVTKWLVLTATANPTTINANGTSTITADLSHDSDWCLS